jgi:hypothetical protein
MPTATDMAVPHEKPENDMSAADRTGLASLPDAGEVLDTPVDENAHE